MKKGDRRRQNKHKRKTIKLNAGQLRRVHKARKGLRKNPAFGKFSDSMLIDTACDMAILSLLKTLGVSSKSILEVLVPVVTEILEKKGLPATEIPIGMGVSIGLNKKPEA